MYFRSRQPRVAAEVSHPVQLQDEGVQELLHQPVLLLRRAMPVLSLSQARSIGATQEEVSIDLFEKSYGNQGHRPQTNSK